MELDRFHLIKTQESEKKKKLEGGRISIKKSGMEFSPPLMYL